MSSPSWIRKNSMPKAVFLLVAACALLCPVIFSQGTEAGSAEGIFYQANAAYEAGAYDKAISGYDSILKEGLMSGELYYNLANCYLKKGDIGMAVLNYKRAMIFIPRDSALLINYGYALSQTKQRDTVMSEPYLIMRLKEIFDFLTLKEAVFIFMALYYMAAIVIIIRKFVRRRRLLSWMAEVLLILATICTAIPLVDKIDKAGKEAIVITATADARIEPMNDAATVFPLYNGMKVYVLKSKKDWCKVKRPDGKIGWLSSEDVSKVFSLL